MYSISKALKGFKTLNTSNSKRWINTDSYSNKLTFFLNGEKREIDSSVVEPESTLIDYIRDKESLKGTKLTCGEGGCGACTVTLTHFDQKSNKYINRAVNSCLVPLCYVDGMNVTTVEGLGSTTSGKLHPVQERLSTWAGSQCGYCTPGFAMSMYTHLRNNPNPKSGEMCKSLDGNLCRCTGYRPIIDAVKSFCDDTKDTVKPPGGHKFAPYEPSKDPQFPPELKSMNPRPVHIEGQRSRWYAPTSLHDLLELKAKFPESKLVNGSTELGIDLRFKLVNIPVMLSPVNVTEMSHFKVTDQGVEIGASVTLNRITDKIHHLIESFTPEQAHRSRCLKAISDQLHWFAGTQIRNVASLGGNIVNASPISDLNPVWMVINASFKLASVKGERIVPASEFFLPGYKKINMKPDEVLVSVSFPWNEKNEYIESYKQSKRREDDIAIVTACLALKVDEKRNISNARISYGGMAPATILANKTDQFLNGKQLNQKTLDETLEILSNEVGLKGDPPGGMAEYRTSLALSFLYKFYVSVLQSVSPKDLPVGVSSASMKLFESQVPTGKQVYEVPKRGISVGDSEIHLSSQKQVTGEAVYTTDIPPFHRELTGALVMSKRAHALIKNVDYSEALRVPGVKGIYDHKNITGSNLWGDIVNDEETFASKQVYYYGQPIAVVVAEDEYTAKFASKLVRVEYEELPNPIFTIEDAIKHNSFFPVVRELNDGDLNKGFQESDHTIEGVVNMGGQEHFYFEPNVSVAVPEDTDIIIHASTQNANKTQKIVANTLGVPANKVIVKMHRIGGGFGGKESRTILFSSIAAVAAKHSGRPVRILLDRDVDMTISGGRHPFRGDYKVGFTKEGKIKALDIKVYNNGGLSHDLSYPVLERAMLFQDSCYQIPNIRVIGRVCKTNMPSNTAFRGFGGPQGHMMAETWIEHVAKVLNKPVEKIRELNLYNEGDLTYYKFPVTRNVRASWEECKKQSDFEKRRIAVAEFNRNNKHRKRGISLMPAKYGIGFTANHLNQGAALIHIYTDGSVLVNHGGVEMGQGLHTKVAQVVATELNIPVSKIHIRETATDKIPNASPTAASMGSDLFAMAALVAAKQLSERLAPYRAANPNADFKDIANKAYFDRVNLSAQGHWKSEHGGFDFNVGKGQPWRYFTLGTACTEVEVDTLTGDFKVLRSDIVMDVGQPINPAIDIGQIEGAFVQGMGWTTIEELVWGDSQHSWIKPEGRLSGAGPGAYKIPSADDIPTDFRVTLMQDTPIKKYEIIAVQSSKAVGEPPLLLGVTAHFAIRDAIAAAREQEGLPAYVQLASPLTSERVRMACADKITRLAVGDKEKAENFVAKGSF